MPITKDMAERQEKHGTPIRDLVLNLYAECGDLGQVAESLEITRATLWTWRLRLGITEKELEIARAKRVAAQS